MTPRSPARALFAVLAGLAACTLNPAAPSIDDVSPNWAYNGEPTKIEIIGAHFFPTVIVGDTIGSDADGGRIEGTFQAWLVGEETYALDGVQHIAYDRVGAEVPEGLPTGIYDLRVEVPSGLVATAEGVFTVSDTRADHLDITVEDGVAYTVGEEAGLTVRLQDPEDQGVTQPLEVEIVATPDDPATTVAFDADGLIDQVSILDGAGVRGWLSSTGIGLVKVTSEAVDDIDFEVTAVAPTTVRGDKLRLSWAAGEVASVEVILPSANFQATAGEPFDVTIRFRDPFDNVLPSEGTSVSLVDECRSWFELNAEVGAGDTIDVELTEACAANRIIVNAFARNWESEVFEVRPALHAGYTVEPVFSAVIAGEELPVFVNAVDAFGNLLPDHTATLTLYDDQGGLDPGRARGEQSCSGFTSGTAYCRVSPWTAGPAVVLRATDEEGKLGFAPAIEVVPADGATVMVLLDESLVEAGEHFEAQVRVLDVYGNSVQFDPAGIDPVSWVDDSGTIDCAWTGAVEGAQGFSCAIYGAVPDASIEAHVLGLTGTVGDALQVINAALGDVEVDPQGASFVAGSAFTVELRGFDAYGNAYIVQTDAVVDLTTRSDEDAIETMVPSTAELGVAGVVQVSVVVYRSGSAVRLYASQGGARLGASRPLLVTPDVMDGFDIAAPPWISVDEPGAVVVTAADAYGNAITNYVGSVTLSSVGQACDTVVVDELSAGTTTVELICATPMLAEVLQAIDTTGFEGASDVVDIVDLACAGGPTAALALDGYEDTLRCLADGGSVEVDADSSASVAGSGGGITVRHYSDVESPSLRTAAAATTFTYDTTGTRYLEVLVADAQACADLAGGYAYVGSDGGEPTGPVAMSTSASTAPTGTSVTVTVSARDCTEDIAAGQELLVRADLGSLTGTPTGEGMLVTLDGAGSASVTWTFDTGFDGTATVYAGAAGGGAIGSKSVQVTGDIVLPTVIEVIPSGTELGSIPTIGVTFSEAMNTSLFTSAYLALSGPSGVIPADFAYSSDQMTVVVTPHTPIAGAEGAFSLVLSQNLRDHAGNRLDGAWSGSRAAAILPFGNVAESVPDISSCSATVDTFTPDGDNGEGIQADAVGVTPTATAAPLWWWLAVYDEAGTRVRSRRVTGTEASVFWDGRGNDGILRDAGQYGLSLAPVDSSGNVGGQCDVTVELQQNVDVP
ncbi:MAG: Ig-like domain-containing protein [Pseudomonadota bacterium]|nr:Ig-like domain-containing protein [Pseudomonadota bacterium]